MHILHAFDWRYSEVIAEIESIARAGFSAILLPPSLHTQHGINNTPGPWFLRYQPFSYRHIYNGLGTKSELINLINIAKKHNIKIYADLLCNFMANEGCNRGLKYPNLMTELPDNPEYTLIGAELNLSVFDENDFEPAQYIKDWNNVDQVQNGRLSGSDTDLGLPKLKCNDNVIATQKAYIDALLDIGVTGFRIDAAKHLKEHHFHALVNHIPNDCYVFGEIITNGGRNTDEYERFLAPRLHAPIKYYDFPFFHTAFRLIKEKNFGRLEETLASIDDVGGKGIAFYTNHDINSI